MSAMQDIPRGFYTWAGPVGVAALVVIIVMAVKGWISLSGSRAEEAFATKATPLLKLDHYPRGHRRWTVLRPHLPPLADERFPKEQTRFILIVRSATELDIVGRRFPSRRVRRDVVEFEERSLAAPACASDERAASLIAVPDCTPDSGRYVAPPRSALTRALLRGRLTGKSAPLEVADE